ncbi:MAG: hypothetical protein ACE5NL_01935 [Candidatus Hydrothermarchaeaceae archaeon]
MKAYLCGKGHCPAVLKTADGVEIGEGKNIVKLTYEEWNSLVEKIQEEELHKI